MEIIYSDQKPKFDKPSIFLAGPTYRKFDKVVEGSFWRKDALEILESLNFDGIVFVPERKFDKFDYNDQVEWEYKCLEDSDVIVFWVPRDKEHLRAMTTNVEFGRYVGCLTTVYGRPDNSDNNRYLDWLYEKLSGRKPINNLKDLMVFSVGMVNMVVEINKNATQKIKTGNI